MSNKTDSPEPGSDEYDLAMMRKYRAQQTGEEEAPLGDLGLGIRQTPNGPVGVSYKPNETVGHGDATEGVAGISPAEAAHQVERVQLDIARIREELEMRSTLLDPDTNEARYYYEGRDREAREKQLLQLEQATLPYALRVQQTALSDEAAGPTLQESLQAEKDRQEQKRARAQQIAEDEESVQLAIRICERKANGGG